MRNFVTDQLRTSRESCLVHTSKRSPGWNQLSPGLPRATAFAQHKLVQLHTQNDHQVVTAVAAKKPVQVCSCFFASVKYLSILIFRHLKSLRVFYKFLRSNKMERKRQFWGEAVSFAFFISLATSKVYKYNSKSYFKQTIENRMQMIEKQNFMERNFWYLLQ